MRVVVFGIGNILLTDEGVGVHSVEALERSYDLPPEVEIIDGGTSGMDCVTMLENLDLLVIADCVRKTGRAPGEVTRLEGEEINAFFKTKISPHQVGLSDVLATLNFHGLAPKKVVLIGVQPESFATHIGLSDAVAASVPKVVELILAELDAAGLAATKKAA
jgi:hydrogenase maturation protease